MTKTLVNKIPFKGPKTHNQILAQVRTDILATRNTISLIHVAFIVSSFFGKDVLFKEVNHIKRLYYLTLGRLISIGYNRKPERTRKINKIKRKSAKRYIYIRRRAGVYFHDISIIKKYNKWEAERELDNRPYVSLEDYMKYRNLRFSEIAHISEKSIEAVLYKFNDKGHIMYRRGSPGFIKELIKIKAEKDAQNKH